MQIVKVSAFSVQTALMRRTVYWVQQTPTCQITCFLPLGRTPGHDNLALGT